MQATKYPSKTSLGTTGFGRGAAAPRAPQPGPASRSLRRLLKTRVLAAVAPAALLASLCGGVSPHAQALTAADADTSINAFNSAFLVNSGGNTFYKQALNNNAEDGTWTLALDIQGMEDAYERTGSGAHQQLVNDLCNSFLRINPPPYDYDGYNDDIAWNGLALARGYQMTGTANLLTQAEYCFNFIYNRGWDTQYNGGGIWEQQPEKTPAGQAINKTPLATNTTGTLGLLIYQSTGNSDYLTKARQIYDWSWGHLFNPTTGQVYSYINRDGTTDTSTNDAAVYNQGAFVDFAALLYKITGDGNVLRDAQRAADYVKNNEAPDGIISNTAGYLNTWADEYARGLGHLCKWNPSLWPNYFQFMLNNANAAWNNRRTDLNITDNGWARLTPQDNTAIANKFVSAVAMLQFTPVAQPGTGATIAGTHSIVNKLTGQAVDDAGLTGNSKGVVQYKSNGGGNQKWVFTQNSDYSWNIVQSVTKEALDDPGFSTGDNTQMDQYGANGGKNQRWLVDLQTDGTFKITNQYSAKVLDGSSNTTDGYKLTQWGWNGGDQQRWKLQ